MTIMKFIDLPLGARFKYLNDSQNLQWIKISHGGSIAEYREDLMDKKWPGQAVYKITENDSEVRTIQVEAIG